MTGKKLLIWHKQSKGDFYKSPRRGVTINNTVQAIYGVATEWEQHRILRSAVIVRM